MKYTTEIEVDGNPVEVIVEYDYEPACGDGWNEPRLSEDVSIYSVTDTNGAEVDYTPGHEAFLIDDILADIHRQAYENRRIFCWIDKNWGG